MRRLGLQINVLTILVFLAPMAWSASQVETKIKKPYFYELDFKGKKSYALGSLHVGVGVQELPDVVKEKLRSSQTFFTEIKFDDHYLDTTLNHTLEAYRNQLVQRNQSVKELQKSPLSAQEISILEKTFKLPHEIAINLRCDDVMNYFLVDGSLTFPKMISMDFSIQKMAFEQNLNVVALDSMRLREEAEELKARTEPQNSNLSKYDHSTCILRNQLHDPDILKLPKVLAKDISDYRASQIPLETDVAVAYRTSKWLQDQRLINQIVDGGAFIEVGAIHLLGRYGMLSVLKSRGVEIKQIGGN